jgi:uncharacterized protein (TIGR03437 family)
MRIPLPVPFSASGKHFISVQTVSDLLWSWRTANSSGPMLSTLKLRNRATNSSWSTPRASDLAFVLYGTLAGPPQLTSMSQTTLAKSGRLRLFGSSFGSTRGIGQVKIGGLDAPITRWNNTTIHAYVPEALPPGTHQVQVITSTGSSATLPLSVTNRAFPSGQAAWRFQADSSGISTPPIVTPDGTIYVMDNSGNLYALDVVPNGSINAADLGLVKAHSGSSLTSVPARTEAKR